MLRLLRCIILPNIRTNRVVRKVKICLSGLLIKLPFLKIVHSGFGASVAWYDGFSDDSSRYEFERLHNIQNHHRQGSGTSNRILKTSRTVLSRYYPVPGLFHPSIPICLVVRDTGSRWHWYIGYPGRCLRFLVSHAWQWLAPLHFYTRLHSWSC